MEQTILDGKIRCLMTVLNLFNFMDPKLQPIPEPDPNKFLKNERKTSCRYVEKRHR